MEISIIKLLIENLPGIITGVITGVIILVIEYKTGFFIRRKAEGSKNLYPSSIPRIQKVSDWNIFDLFFQLAIFLLIFIMVFFAIGMPVSFMLSGKTSTTLDSSESTSIVVKNIGEGDTAAFFNNEFFVTLNHVMDGNRVSFTVGQVGSPSQYTEGAYNGTAVLFNLNNANYDVRVTSISWMPMFGKSNADFTVTKLP